MALYNTRMEFFGIFKFDSLLLTISFFHFKDCNWFFTDSDAEGAYNVYKMYENDDPYPYSMNFDEYKNKFFTKKYSCLVSTF